MYLKCKTEAGTIKINGPFLERNGPQLYRNENLYSYRKASIGSRPEAFNAG